MQHLFLKDGSLKYFGNTTRRGIRIKTGRKISTDALVKRQILTSGTGEYMPIYKTIRDEVISGTFKYKWNYRSSSFKRIKDTTLSKIVANY